VIVVSHDALGVLAWTASDFREALRWFQMAEEEQARFGGRWVGDISAKRKRLKSWQRSPTRLSSCFTNKKCQRAKDQLATEGEVTEG